MGPPEEYEDGGPPSAEEAEEGEVRGSMEGYPRESDARARPLQLRLLQGLRRRGQQVIQVYPREGVRWRAEEVRARGLRLARGLMALGVREGDRVSLVGARHPEYGPLFLATLLAGAAWAPLNHTFDDDDLRLLLKLLRPKVALALPPTALRLRRLIAQLQEQGELGAETRLVTLCEGEEWEELSREREVEEGEEGGRWWVVPPPADPKGAVAVVACSSGTSGPSKGVVTSHYTLLCALQVFMRPDAAPGVEGTVLLTSPGFWVTGIWFTLLSMLHSTVIVYDYGCTEHEFLESIEKHRPPAVFTGNNFLLSAAKAHEASGEGEGRRRRDLSSVRSLLTGGAAMSAQAERFVARVMGCAVLNMYGMTELNGGIGLGARPTHKPGSVGRLAPFLRCKVVDPSTGRALGPGAEGELRFKGPSLTSGYLGDAKATAELFDARGWLRSGDLGRYDAEGDFWVTGRIKDTIKFRGAHVSPVDVEGVLEAHGAVLESAVVGVPDPLNGELPRAFVVLRPGAAATAEELERLVRERAAEHKWLRGGVVFLDALPKTPTGKISRNDIRKRYVLPLLPNDHDDTF